MKKINYILCAFLLSTTISTAQSPIQWNAEMNVAPSSSGNEHPRIALDRSGNPLVIWHHVSRCMFSKWNGSAFTTPVLLNPASMTIAGASWMGPDIASHGDSVYAVFKETPEGSDTSHVYCVHSYNGGMTFSAPIQVDNIGDSLSRFPTVTADDNGNPIIGFMKFNPAFSDERWVVTRSADFGNTFSPDIKASGWSSPTSTVCNCCPGSVACSGNSVAMLYRDNNADIRDSWAGISTDNGYSFPGGFGIDQQNWLYPACPSSGPDGVIIGDTLYATFMNGVSGIDRVYYSKTSIPAMNGSTAIGLTGTIGGLTEQNYPRIATDGNALGIVWKQTVNGSDQCVLRFTNNIANGLPAAYDTVDLNNVTNCDVAISNGNIYVVWEDDNTGTIRYRSGTFTPVTGIQNMGVQNSITIFPNPASSDVNIVSKKIIDKINIVNISGQIIYETEPRENNIKLNFNKAGIYFMSVRCDHQTTVRKLVVIQSSQ
jgi:hypothetical protein